MTIPRAYEYTLDEIEFKIGHPSRPDTTEGRDLASSTRTVPASSGANRLEMPKCWLSHWLIWFYCFENEIIQVYENGDLLAPGLDWPRNNYENNLPTDVD